MFITGLGNVVGIGPMTRICVDNNMLRIRDLDDQALSSLIPMVCENFPITYAAQGTDNRPLRKRLLRLNPHLRPDSRS